MMRLNPRLSCCAAIFATVGCGSWSADEIGESEKGSVELSIPELQVTKASEEFSWFSQALAGIESHHPYGNNEDHTWEVEAPWCADHVRLHFASFALEYRYDNVYLVDEHGRTHGRYTGAKSPFTSIVLPGHAMTLRLITDYSVVAEGFLADRLDFHVPPMRCPMMPTLACPAGTVDVTPPNDPCDCPGMRVCEPIERVLLEHGTGGGFSGMWNTRNVSERVAREARRWPNNLNEVTELGLVDTDQLTAYVQHLVDEGVFTLEPTVNPANMSESFRLVIGDREANFVAPIGELPPMIRASLNAFEALFVCGDGAALTCAAGLLCEQGRCIDEPSPCICTEQYEPVCGADGRTYDNPCFAACAETTVAHPGACNPWMAWETLLESAHPYSNDLEQAFTVTPPRPASQLRIHFSRFQLEEDYDFLSIRDAHGNELERLTGVHDDRVVEVPTGTATLELSTDYSVTGYGFVVRRIEYLPRPDCPQLAPPAPGFCVGGEIIGRVDENGCARSPLCRRAEGAACNTGMRWPCDEGFGCVLNPDEVLPNGVGTCRANAHRPTCGAIGSRSEGWYWSDSDERIGWATCAGVEAVCAAVGSRSEGWYRADGEGLVAYDLCAPQPEWLTGGTLESAHPYANNTDQRWSIEAPAEATRLRLVFDTLDLEPYYDYLYVLDADDTVVRNLDGSHANLTIELSGRAAALRLLTDASITATGFSVTWTYSR